MYIFLVILLGFALRTTFFVRPEGLWNDEYVSLMVASTPFNHGFWEEVFKQCHMPLYYLYLKPFAHCGDIILRFTSLIPSMIAIWVMYLLGKEFSEKCGKAAALLTAILPFLVYYSQEVRLYSLVFLLSALVLLFLIRLLKNVSTKNIALYSLFSLILIFTHVLGIIYVFFTTAYLIYKKKLLSKKIFIACAVVGLLVLPFGINILRQLPSAQWWGIFSYTNLMFLFSDFFSPVLTNNVNAPPMFYYRKDFLFVFMITIPTLIGLFGCYLGNKKLNKDILVIPIAIIIVMSILTMTGKLVFITKYSIEILPLLILAISAGFDEEDKLEKILLNTFVIINILAIFTVYYPTKAMRTEGHNLPVQILNSQNPDKIIYTYYAPDRFKRYLKIDKPSKYISKINRFEYLDNTQRIFDDVKSGDHVAIVFLNSVSFIPENKIEEAKSRNIPEMFISFSIIRHNIEKYIEQELYDTTVSYNGNWTIVDGIKK